MNSAGITRNGLISADRVAGTIVYDLSGQGLGDIHSIMIDKVSGKIAYVVVKFADDGNIGARFHPLPWHLLEYDTQLDGYRVDIAQGDLEGAPFYDHDEIGGFDKDHRDSVDHFSRPMTDNDDAVVNRSDLNDGIDRPLGFYSRKAQALRNGNLDTHGADETPNLRADESAPDFYSPAQQQARSNINSIDDQVRRPDPTLVEIDGRNDATDR